MYFSFTFNSKHALFKIQKIKYKYIYTQSSKQFKNIFFHCKVCDTNLILNIKTGLITRENHKKKENRNFI